jgi:threonine synthase
VVATNSNDTLARFFKDGNYDKYPVLQTFSPSMDIGISSDFERYLFYLFGEDSKKLASMMNQFNETGRLGVSKEQLATAREDFLAASCSEQMTIEYISKFHKEYRYTLDPHTACGVAAVEQVRSQMDPEGPKHKIVVLGTAHPAKFSMAVAKAIGSPPELPKAMQDMQGAEVRFQVLPAKTATIKNMIEQTVPDDSGARNVYSMKHFAGLSMLLGAAFVAGVAVGKAK